MNLIAELEAEQIKALARTSPTSPPATPCASATR